MHRRNLEPHRLADHFQDAGQFVASSTEQQSWEGQDERLARPGLVPLRRAHRSSRGRGNRSSGGSRQPLSRQHHRAYLRPEEPEADYQEDERGKDIIAGKSAEHERRAGHLAHV